MGNTVNSDALVTSEAPILQGDTVNDDTLITSGAPIPHVSSNFGGALKCFLETMAEKTGSQI